MKLDDKNAFGKLLSATADLYGKKVSADLLEIYWRALERYSLAEIAHALDVHVLNPDNGQFMPKPADIMRSLHGETTVQALRAWSKITAAIKAIGAYDSIVFDDPIIHLVIQEMDGWIRLCQTEQEKLPFIANEFQKRYAAYVLHKPKNYPHKLMGIFEQQNVLKIKSSTEPQFFGDLAEAKLVYAQGINSDTTKPSAVIKPANSLTPIVIAQEKIT